MIILMIWPGVRVHCDRMFKKTRYRGIRVLVPEQAIRVFVSGVRFPPPMIGGNFDVFTLQVTIRPLMNAIKISSQDLR
jgi:hypothetical protein